MNFPNDLKCPRCRSDNITYEGEWYVFCLDCGAMPNRDGYQHLSSAIRAFRRWMDIPWSAEAEAVYRSDP